MQTNLESRINLSKKFNPLKDYQNYPSIPDNFDIPTQLIPNKKINLLAKKISKKASLLESIPNNPFDSKKLSNKTSSLSSSLNSGLIDIERKRPFNFQNRNSLKYDNQNYYFNVVIIREIR